MSLLLILAIGVVVLMIAMILLKLRAGPAAQDDLAQVYYRRDSLFTPAERSFLGVLVMLNYDGVTISSKVRLADVFGLKKGLDRSARQRAINRIQAKHVDFLLLQSSDGKPLLGIELDDSSHQAEARQKRDAFVDAVFSATGLPILHVTVKTAYDPKEIHRQIEAALKLSDR